MWPRVLLACTSPLTVATFKRILAPVCLEFGLHLETAATDQGNFESSEHLLQTVSGMPATELFDTLVLLLDVGPDIEECFLSSVTKGQSSWHVSRFSKPGVGLDLVL